MKKLMRNIVNTVLLIDNSSVYSKDFICLWNNRMITQTHKKHAKTKKMSALDATVFSVDTVSWRLSSRQFLADSV